jgi:hypothetical protein
MPFRKIEQIHARSTGLCPGSSPIFAPQIYHNRWYARTTPSSLAESSVATAAAPPADEANASPLTGSQLGPQYSRSMLKVPSAAMAHSVAAPSTENQQ